MKVLFAMRYEQTSKKVADRYLEKFGEELEYKNVFYFKALLEEVKNNKTYDRIVVSEDLEQYEQRNLDALDRYIFNNIDSLTDEIEDSEILFICSDRRTKDHDKFVERLFNIGVYNTLIGDERNVTSLCEFIRKPMNKKEAKRHLNIDPVVSSETTSTRDDEVEEVQMMNILKYYDNIKGKTDEYLPAFDRIAEQYSRKQLKVILSYLPADVKKAVISSDKYAFLVEQDNMQSAKNDKNKKSDGNKSARRGLFGILMDNKNKAMKKVKNSLKPNVVHEENNIKNDESISQKEYMPIGEEIENQNEQSKVKIQDVREKMQSELMAQFGDEEPQKQTEGLERQQEELKKMAEQEALEREQMEQKAKAEREELQKQQEELRKMAEQEALEREQMEQKAKAEREAIEKAKLEQEEAKRQLETNFAQNNAEQERLEAERRKLEEERRALELERQKLKEQSEQIVQNADSRAYDNNQEVFDNRKLDVKKMVAFVGANKSGTTFVINAIAHKLAENGVSVGVLDITRDKNLYYIYNQDDKDLRQIASQCMQKLSEGIDSYLPGGKNLKIYTSIPGTYSETRAGYKNRAVIDTVCESNGLVIIDADFATPLEYFEKAEEIYIVQDMDIMKLQETTVFLRELKGRSINMKKIKVIINKYVKCLLTPKKLIQGLSYYNDPQMSFIDELLESKVQYYTIPFNIDNYAKYIDGTFKNSIDYKKFSSDFMQSIGEISNDVYRRSNSSNANVKRRGFFG